MPDGKQEWLATFGEAVRDLERAKEQLRGLEQAFAREVQLWGEVVSHLQRNPQSMALDPGSDLNRLDVAKLREMGQRLQALGNEIVRLEQAKEEANRQLSKY